jgi:dTDP-4-dehydrorhamnose reductase
MRVLLTGATGLLGRYLIAQRPAGVQLFGVSRRAQSPIDGVTWLREDLTASNAAQNVVNRCSPDYIIHAAAEGRVDTVQEKPSAFLRLNVELPADLARLSQERQAGFMFISSNAVFGGRPEPYSDFSKPDPINMYGELKRDAERKVEEVAPESAIVRPILMYGWQSPGERTNLVTGWLATLEAGETIAGAEDVTSQPLYASDAASAIWLAVERDVTGPMNVSGGVATTLAELAELVADVFGHPGSRVTSSKSEGFALSAPRPRHTLFDLDRLRNELNFQPDGPAFGLERMRSEAGSRSRMN